MGDTLSEIRDDIDEYRELCRRFAEPVQFKHHSPDCYGDHAKLLKQRASLSDSLGGYAAGDFNCALAPTGQ